MKKSLFFIVAMLVSTTASAQFVVFESATVGSNSRKIQQQSSNDSYNGYYNQNQYYQSPQRPQTQVLSTRGYYIKDNQWNSVLLRVKIIGDDIYVIGINRQSTGWSNCSSKASSTQFMQQNIKDNFDYYIGDYVYGKIYF